MRDMYTEIDFELIKLELSGNYGEVVHVFLCDFTPCNLTLNASI